MKKQSLPLTPILFKLLYVNLWNDCRVIPQQIFRYILSNKQQFVAQIEAAVFTHLTKVTWRNFHCRQKSGFAHPHYFRSRHATAQKGCTKFHISGKSWLMINDCLSETDLAIIQYRSSTPEVFLGKGVLKISYKFTGKNPCWSVISIKLLCNFTEIPLRHGCSPVNFL